MSQTFRRRTTVLAAACVLAGLPVFAAEDSTPAAVQSQDLSLEQVAAQFGTNDPDLQRSALSEVKRHLDWSDQAATLVHRWLAEPDLAEAKEAELTGLLQLFGYRSSIERDVSETLIDARTDRRTRLVLLRILARLGSSGLPARWVDAVAKSLEGADPALVHEALRTAQACDLRKLNPRIRTIVGQEELPARLRIAAIRCLSSSAERFEAEWFVFLTRQLSQEADPVIAVDAARALGTGHLDRSQLLTLCERLAEADATPGLLLLPAYGKSREAAVGSALIAALERATVLGVVTVADLDRLLTNYPDAVRKSAMPLRERLLLSDKTETDKLAGIAQKLPPGDPDRGREVFFSQKSACSTCHGLAGKGGGVGPSLSRVAFIRGRSELLESVVSPSAFVDPEFRNWVLLTESGTVFSGLLVHETTDAYYLRSGPQATERVALDEVEEIKISRQSLMPEGIERLLTPQELSNLVEFLSQQH